jgi:hypothetical protein
MYKNKIFCEIVKLIPRNFFTELKTKYQSDRRVRTLDSWGHLLVHLFGAIAAKRSLRTLLDGFNGLQQDFYHINVRSIIKRSTLSDANSQRDFHLFKELFESIQSLYGPGLPKRFRRSIKRTINLMDATIFTVPAGLYPWAYQNVTPVGKVNHGIKIHCIYDGQRGFPKDIQVELAKEQDLQIAYQLDYKKGELYIFDRGYFSFSFFNSLDDYGAFFITRGKDFHYQVIDHKEPDHANILKDEIVTLTGKKGKHFSELRLRRIEYYYPEKDEVLVFITNIFDLDASTITDSYRLRWQIEIFFRELKHYLKLQTFLGTSFNAVAIQVYTYAIAYILLKVYKARLNVALNWKRFIEIMKTYVSLPVNPMRCDIRKSVFKCKTNQIELNFKT